MLHPPPRLAGKLLEVQELVPPAGAAPASFRCPSAPLVPCTRAASQNEVGVVAWVMTLRTPECPQGRQLVAIANDITHNSGGWRVAPASCGCDAWVGGVHGAVCGSAVRGSTGIGVWLNGGWQYGSRRLGALTAAGCPSALVVRSEVPVRTSQVLCEPVPLPPLFPSPAGAFGPAEDAMFRAATEWALEERLPLVYLAANSGARVGLAAEVKQCLRVRGGGVEGSRGSRERGQQ